MQVGLLADDTDFDGWRRAARAFRQAGVPPAGATFRVADVAGGLFDTVVPPPRAEADFAVPKAFIDLARGVILHRSVDRFDLLYRLLWRLQDEPDLIKVVSDGDVADALERMKNVNRASHKMKAFVRFRLAEEGGDELWSAWFEPAHRVLEKTAPFFVRRFTTMRWSILTPDGGVSWDRSTLRFGPPATRDMVPAGDEIEEFWKTYYASTFNPARLKTRTMQGEMPKQYWKNLPEAALIPDLVAQAAARTDAMVARPAAAPNPRLAKTLSRSNRKQSIAEADLPSTVERPAEAD